MLADLKMLESIQNTQSISREELGSILQTQDSFLIQELHKKAQQTATQIYGNKIYIRGLIEFTNYCKNNCYYCGIRNGNTKADRYRLTTEQIYPVVKPDGTGISYICITGRRGSLLHRCENLPDRSGN